jgi:hypothetical protein
MHCNQFSLTKQEQTTERIPYSNSASIRRLCTDVQFRGEGKGKGTILSRNGDLVKVQNKKTGFVVMVKITDDTKILRDKSKVAFRRHEDMPFVTGSRVSGVAIDPRSSYEGA